MNTAKRVTVFMPVYNGGNYLSEAIESILNQTFKDFELLIINDGSTDNSEEIIKGYKDSRIKYVVNKKNMGIIKTLNKGLDLIQSEYIARMDADDISLPTRLEKQIDFMDKHRDIAVSGTSMLNIYSDGKTKKGIVKNDPRQIKTMLLFTNALAHPTIIIRKKIIDEENLTYNESHQAVEDYGLWVKMSFTNKLANLQEILLKYRVNEKGITQLADKKIQERDVMHMGIYREAFENLGIDVSQDCLTIYRYFITGRAFKDRKNIPEISELLQILKSLINKPEYDLSTFNMLISMYFRANCVSERLTYKESMDIYKEYFQNIFQFNVKEKIKFIFREFF